jgi:hypothetical protein
VDQTALMHRVKSSRYHSEYQHYIEQAQRRPFLQRLPVKVFHRKQHLFCFEHTANLLEPVALANVRVGYFPRYFVFGLDLLENTGIFGPFKNDPLQGHFGSVRIVSGKVYCRARTDPDAFLDSVPAYVKYIFCHIFKTVEICVSASSADKPGV